MGQLVPFPRHHFARCGVNVPRTARCEEGRCMFCEGGLAFCLTCRGGEGDLPTDCPQRPMHEDEHAAVMSGHLDFRRGIWACVSEESRRPLP